MLVGDIIVQAREMITDVPQVIATAPTASFSVVTPASSTLTIGNYFLVVTQRNPWGETLQSAESTSQTVGAGQGIQVTSTLLPGATTIRAYLTFAGGAAGSETQFIESTTSPFTISTNPVLFGTPPTRSSAFLPDTDGRMLSASSLFRWLSQALVEASREVGGILDYTGVGSVVGQPLYTLQGEWLQLSDVWYDGYPVSEIGRNTFFRRNTVQSSILGAVTVSVRDNRVIAEVWPQPARTAATTTTTSQVNIGDSTINVTSTAGFVLPFGFAQVGTEVISYATLTGTSLTGCVRGLSGGVASSWVSGTTVNELNLFMCGKRIFTQAYVPGTSTTVIPVPAGWDEMLIYFILSKEKQAEQDFSESARLRKLFDEMLTGFVRSNRQLAGPRQVTLREEEFSIANPHPFGGTVIP